MSILLEANSGLICMKRTDTSLGMKDNSESALSTNKEAISNVTRNLMESLILAQDERWRHA